ncbi:MAG TPA: transposase [Solimonas sp.]|nr:transposase [Solimonas sp.]
MSRYRRSVTAGATYFFTVALANRSSSLLTEHIEQLRHAYGAVHRKKPFRTVAICVLPEHLHAIWELPPDDADFSGRWRQIKAGFSRHFAASAARSASKIGKREKGIWQRRFWEHQIRDEQDMQRHVDYVHYNPVRHGIVSRTADWPYSSFHRFVRSGDLPLDWAGHSEAERSLLDGEPD